MVMQKKYVCNVMLFVVLLLQRTVQHYNAETYNSSLEFLIQTREHVLKANMSNAL